MYVYVCISQVLLVVSFNDTCLDAGDVKSTSQFAALLFLTGTEAGFGIGGPCRSFENGLQRLCCDGLVQEE